mmetsp:Transcript_25678/g.96663  ORF Transcript_25678/g.96663 Transcript_25678/m.96663 type:complete len:796 (-) Transcript_25678:826-3213(-)
MAAATAAPSSEAPPATAPSARAAPATEPDVPESPAAPPEAASLPASDASSDARAPKNLLACLPANGTASRGVRTPDSGDLGTRAAALAMARSCFWRDSTELGRSPRAPPGPPPVPGTDRAVDVARPAEPREGGDDDAAEPPIRSGSLRAATGAEPAPSSGSPSSPSPSSSSSAHSANGCMPLPLPLPARSAASAGSKPDRATSARVSAADVAALSPAESLLASRRRSRRPLRVRDAVDDPAAGGVPLPNGRAAVAAEPLPAAAEPPLLPRRAHPVSAPLCEAGLLALGPSEPPAPRMAAPPPPAPLPPLPPTAAPAPPPLPATPDRPGVSAPSVCDRRIRCFGKGRPVPSAPPSPHATALPSRAPPTAPSAATGDTPLLCRSGGRATSSPPGRATTVPASSDESNRPAPAPMSGDSVAEAELPRRADVLDMVVAAPEDATGACSGTPTPAEPPLAPAEPPLAPAEPCCSSAPACWPGGDDAAEDWTAVACPPGAAEPARSCLLRARGPAEESTRDRLPGLVWSADGGRPPPLAPPGVPPPLLAEEDDGACLALRSLRCVAADPPPEDWPPSEGGAEGRCSPMGVMAEVDSEAPPSLLLWNIPPKLRVSPVPTVTSPPGELAAPATPRKRFDEPDGAARVPMPVGVSAVCERLSELLNRCRWRLATDDGPRLAVTGMLSLSLWSPSSLASPPAPPASALPLAALPAAAPPAPPPPPPPLLAPAPAPAPPGRPLDAPSPSPPAETPVGPTDESMARRSRVPGAARLSAIDEALLEGWLLPSLLLASRRASALGLPPA